jgi:hypothetical protein
VGLATPLLDVDEENGCCGVAAVNVSVDGVRAEPLLVVEVVLALVVDDVVPLALVVLVAEVVDEAVVPPALTVLLTVEFVVSVGLLKAVVEAKESTTFRTAMGTLRGGRWLSDVIPRWA